MILKYFILHVDFIQPFMKIKMIKQVWNFWYIPCQETVIRLKCGFQFGVKVI